MFLFLKMETSGLYRPELPPSSKAQPWGQCYAVEHVSKDGERFNAFEVLIKPNGRPVKPGAAIAHGIDAELCERVGLSENPMLAYMAELAGKSEAVVTFGDLDNRIMRSLLIRLATDLRKPEDHWLKKWQRDGLTFIDVQKPACQMECKIPSDKEDDEFRWPSLAEAHSTLCSIPIDPKSAWDKLAMIKDLFFTLRAKGHFSEVSHV